MASQPIKRQMITQLASLANPDSLNLPPDTTEDDAAFAYLLAYMENGGRLSRLASDLNVSRFLLDRWVKGTPERASQFSRARARGADALVDEGGDLLDRATRDDVAVANARAGWRKWLAGKVNPEEWGESKQGAPLIGSLHLHAALSRPQLQGADNSPKPPLLGPPLGQREAGYLTESEIVGEPEFHVEHPPTPVDGE